MKIKKILSLILVMVILFQVLVQTYADDTDLSLFKVISSDAIPGMFFINVDSKNACLAKYSGTSENIRIPETIESEGKTYTITSICDHTFENCSSLKNLVIPDSIHTIGSYAFKNCISLESINMPTNLEFIGICTFINCKSLKSVNIPASCKMISKGAFIGCESMEELVLDDGLHSIQDHAFAGCNNLKTVEFPKSLKDVSNGAFNSCESLSTVIWDKPANESFIGDFCFYNCKNLSRVTVPESVFYEENTFPIDCVINGKKTCTSTDRLAFFKTEAKKTRENMLKILEKIKSDKIDLKQFESEDSGHRRHEDLLANLINRYDNFSALPKVVDEKTFKDMSEGKTILYRGIGDSNGKSGIEHGNEFRHGTLSNGTGAYGSGTYTTTNLETAKSYPYEWNIHQNKDTVCVLKMILDDSAKIIDYNDMRQISDFYINDDINYLIFLYENMGTPFMSLLMYNQSLAEITGYDAVRCPRSGEDYYVILNRGKVIVSDKDEK